MSSSHDFTRPGSLLSLNTSWSCGRRIWATGELKWSLETQGAIPTIILAFLNNCFIEYDLEVKDSVVKYIEGLAST